jgi:hypothetical protein
MKKRLSALALALSSAASVAFAQSLSSPQGWTPAPNKLPPADISWQGAYTFLCNPTSILGVIQACPLSLVQPPFAQVPMFQSQNALTATPGVTQSGTQVTVPVSGVTTVASPGDSMVLPTSASALFDVLCDFTGNYMSVFPFSGDAINSGGTNNPVNVPGHSCAIAFGITGNKIAMLSIPYGVAGDIFIGGSDGRPTDSGILLSSLPALPFGQTAFWTVSGNLTALSGGGQAGATALTAVANNLATVGANCDSAALPAVTSAQVGMVVVVGNTSGAGHYACVWGHNAGDLIDGLSNVPLGAGSSATFVLGSVPAGVAKWQVSYTLIGASGRLVNFNSNGQMQDSGTLLTALAPLNSPALTTPSIAGCSSQGSIIYVNSAGAESCISPATSGQVLVTKGAGANPVFASPITWMTSTTKATLTAATQYYMPLSGATISSNTAVGAASAILGLGGTFGVSGGRGQFTCTVATAPGAGQTDTCTLYQNATAEAVTCTISGTNTQCTDAADSFVGDGTHNYGIGFLMSATATAPVEVYTALSWSTP